VTAASRTGEGDGYRARPRGGPIVRTDVVDVYVFRDRGAGPVEFLQLRRATEPLRATWHPIMGHVEPDERAPATALRELKEEVGLARDDAALLGFWALEQTHPYYVPAVESIVLGPRFAVRVSPEWTPRLDREHDASRWVALPRDAAAAERDAALPSFLWPGQRRAVLEIISELVPAASLSREALRLDPRGI